MTSLPLKNMEDLKFNNKSHSQKQKKSKKRKGKNDQLSKLAKSAYQIIKPQRFLQPISIFRIYTDFAILDKPRVDCYNEPIGQSSLFKAFKYIQRVEFNQKQQTVELLLGDQNLEMHPLKLLQERLESLNLKDAHKLAKLLEQFKRVFDFSESQEEDNYNPIIYPEKKYFQQKFSQILTEFQEYPCIFMHYENYLPSRDELRLRSIGYNMSLIHLLTNDIETFKQRLLENGTKDFQICSNYYKFCGKGIANFYRVDCKNLKEKAFPIQIIGKNNQLFSCDVVQRVIKFQKGIHKSMYLFRIFKVKSFEFEKFQRMLQEKTLNTTPEIPTFSELNLETQDFLENHYQHIAKKYYTNNALKVCNYETIEKN